MIRGLRFAFGALLFALSYCLPTAFASDVAPALPPPAAKQAPATKDAATPAATTNAKSEAIDDGPHIKDVPGVNAREAIWVCGNTLYRERLASKVTQVEPRCGYPRPIRLRAESFRFPAPATFEAERLVAFSDVHGQFELLVKLLQAHQVIDAELHWTFGNGHMVVIGDHFDRGPRVTEVLWLLHQLEAEALAAGGRVHTLIGNHETMVLYDDLRYVHAKYGAIARIHDMPLPGQFGTDSVLGRWLRSKPVIIQVNDMLFVHGGLGPEFLRQDLSLTETNEQFRKSIGMPRPLVRADPTWSKLYGPKGPIWHRSYFIEPLMTSKEIDLVLDRFKVRRVVVGHTTFKSVYSHHGGRVLSVDSDLQRGNSGELLFWDNGKIARGDLRGNRAPVPEYGSGR